MNTSFFGITNGQTLFLGLCCSFLLVLSGCLNVPQEKEARGILTVNHSAMANTMLEFPDKTLRQTRFIHPGRKIIEIDRSGVSVKFRMLDSRRVQLAELDIPVSLFSQNRQRPEEFFIRSSQIPASQAGGKVLFDIQGIVKTKLISIERTRTESNTKRCRVAQCSAPQSCEGVTGEFWEVKEERTDYVINFLVKSTQKVWAEFNAKGEMKVSARQMITRECLPEKTVYIKSNEEVF